MVDLQSFRVFVDGEEVPGLMFYGLDRPSNPVDVVFPRHVWPSYSSLEEFTLGGETWRVHLWELAMDGMASSPEFAQAVSTTLVSIVESGCVVAWVGIEGYFCDPPNLFVPECMSNGIFALRTRSGLSWNSFTHSGDCPAAPDDLLREVRSETIDLSGAEA